VVLLVCIMANCPNFSCIWKYTTACKIATTEGHAPSRNGIFFVDIIDGSATAPVL